MMQISLMSHEAQMWVLSSNRNMAPFCNFLHQNACVLRANASSLTGSTFQPKMF